MPSPDSIVIGGGAVGAACAWELASTGRKVLILEAGGRAGQAWRAAAGMLAPQIETGTGDRLLPLGLALGLVVTAAGLAFVGFIIYLILRVLAPGAAARVREMIAGH